VVRFAWAFAIAYGGVLVACASTPDLRYGEGDATTEGGGFDATTGPTDDGAPGQDTNAPDAGSDGTAEPDAQDAEPDIPAIDSAATDACPPVDSSITHGCCPNVGVVCVKASCSHCGACASAGCTQAQFCCPYYAGGSGNYKGTECKNDIGSCN
jgi:hypothetical protein